MRYSLLIFSIIFFAIDLYSQIKPTRFEDFPKEIVDRIDSMGKDTCSILTQLEGEYFNVFFENSRGNYNFCGKKVAFLSGSLGKVIIDKETYFNSEQTNIKQNGSPAFAFLYIFNEIQKKETYGYDAAIVIWSKKELSIKSVVKILKEQELKREKCRKK